MGKDSLAVRFLYGTRAGRMIMGHLLHSRVDKMMVRFLWSPLSKPVIPLYIKLNHISMKEFEGKKYSSFREFFIREREPVEVDLNPEHLVSPCDGWLSAFPIEEDSSFWVKGSKYKLNDLLHDRKLAEQFYGGDCLIFRLCASDYHHYSYIDDGRQGASHYIPGMLHSVQPSACQVYPVYTLNRRVWTVLETEHFGTVVQTEVGAFVVGGIVNDHDNEHFMKGMEKGHFELAGSSIVMLFQKDKIQLRSEVISVLRQDKEFRVKQGMWIGERKKDRQG